nr:putative disease resistance gene NBS-LRR family protein [Populus alba]
MADALVSKVLQQLTSAIENESALILGGKKKVEKLSTTLTAIRSVLIDAEKKQVKERSVRVWLEQLEAISYDLDDLLDEWNTKICEPKRMEIMDHHHSSLSKKMVRLSNFLSPCFCVNQLVMHRDIGSKMECIKERLDEVANEKDKMHDIVQSFAQFLSKNQCFVIEFDDNKVLELNTKARHMTLMGKEEQFHPVIFNLKNLRTLQVLQKNVKTAPPDLFHGMQCLRGLDLNHTSITRLPSAIGHLEISGLEKVRDVNEVMEANLKNKEHLRSLDLAFSFGGQELITNVLEALQPHPNLEALLVYDYGGSILPSWMSLLTKMKDLKLLRCVNCKELPPLGKLPSLEKLLIGHLNNVKCVGVEFLGIDPVTDQNSVTESIVLFPKLKELTFRYMVEWENWDTTTITSAATRRTMPCLRSLSLYDCPKLKAIPEGLKQRPLEELIITRCPILEQQ